MATSNVHLDAALEPSWKENLRARFLRDFGSDVLWRELSAAYSDPSRAYHSLSHLGFMFSQYDRVEHLLVQPPAVRAAIWFHDFVYETDSDAYPHNEARSAEAMCQLLADSSLGTESLELAVELILATKTHRADAPYFSARPQARADCHLFLDIDLAILACAPAQVVAFDDAVREEFRQYPDAEFARGRVRVLAAFLARRQVFFSSAFVSYEGTARDNLKMLVERWSQWLP